MDKEMTDLDVEPSEANWYWEVIYATVYGTDYAYGYSIEDPTETVKYLFPHDVIEMNVTRIEPVYAHPSKILKTGTATFQDVR